MSGDPTHTPKNGLNPNDYQNKHQNQDNIPNQPETPSKKHSTTNKLLIDQTVAAITDFVLIHHPLDILRLQCQANSHSLVRHHNPLSCANLWVSQFSQHGLFSSFTKGLQTNCAYITLEGIAKRIFVELISEISGVDLNLIPSYKFESLSSVKNLISTNCLSAVAETLKTIFLTTFYSSNTLIKVQSLLAANEKSNHIDYVALMEFFRVGFSRLALDIDSEGYTWDALPFTKLVLPTLISCGSESMCYTFLYPFFKYIYNLAIFHVENTDENSKDGRQFTEREIFYRDRFVHLITYFVTKLICYKFEVVSTKLHVQGTRMLVDDTTIGYGVVPIKTRFEGFWNCWRNVRLMGQSYDGVGFVVLDVSLRCIIAYMTSKL